jgi:hypothetical protein
MDRWPHNKAIHNKREIEGFCFPLVKSQNVYWFYEIENRDHGSF